MGGFLIPPGLLISGSAVLRKLEVPATHRRSFSASRASGSSPSANLLTGGIDEIFAQMDASAGSYLADGLGSTLALTDATGALTTQYTYEPYGNTSSNGGTPAETFQFTGRENDGTNLYFYRARYYSPIFQRFISQDPIGFRGGLNLYEYTGSNPISFADPFGTDKKKWACTADAALNFGLGFIPGYNALKLGATLLGVSLNPFQNVVDHSPAITTGPTPIWTLAGVASGYSLYGNASFDAAGGAAGLARLADLTSRVGFPLKSEAAQAELLGKLGNLSKLANAASTAGTVANLLNAAGTAYDIYNCWNP